MSKPVIDMDYSKYGFRDPEALVYKAERGFSEAIVKEISDIKNEPEWVRRFRLHSYGVFLRKPMPLWGGDMSSIDFDEMVYYARPSEKQGRTWEEVPENIARTFERLGIPQAERKFLAGVGAQYESEVVYHSLREELVKQGVIFVDPDSGLREHEKIFRPWFGRLVPPEDNKFAALNSTVFSGGSFIYVPPGVEVKQPLQAYFRINAESFGQFERTLIIADRGSRVHYIEGCTAPVYSSDSLHSAVVELIALPGAYLRYTTLQNWSTNVYNLVTKRAYAHENATVEWVDANIGCLVRGTKIFTNNDVKQIEEVEVGDRVYSMNQDLGIVSRQVVAKRENPPSDVYRLITSNFREVSATAGHPILVMRKEGKLNHISWRQLKDIRPGDLVAIAGELPDRGMPRKTEFEHVEKAKKKIKVPTETDEDVMWLLGFYLGDGFVDGRARLSFAVPESDPANRKVKTIVKEVFGLDHSQRKDTVRVNSADFVKFIETLGFLGNARTKTVPRWVFTVPKSQKLAFIEGYLMADGHTRKGHKNSSITSANKQLLEQVKTLAISCGLNATKISKWSRKERKKLGKEEKQYTHYSLYFWNERLGSHIYFVPVSKIEYVGREVTYDIEVEGTQNFIANGIFVHNSKLTMKYPSVYMVGKGAKAEILSVAFAGKGQHQDAGGKAVHLAPYTTSRITSKSLCKDGGRASYRGLLHVAKGAHNVKSSIRCDALILDDRSRTDTYPYNEIFEDDATVTHEATVGKIGQDQLFYLMSRGLTEQEALNMVVLGFMEPFSKSLPMEYSIEFNKLIELEMVGSVG